MPEQDPIQRLEADMTVDGAALMLAAAVLGREAEAKIHAGALEDAETLLTAAQLLRARYERCKPMMVQPS